MTNREKLERVRAAVVEMWAHRNDFDLPAEVSSGRMPCPVPVDVGLLAVAHSEICAISLHEEPAHLRPLEKESKAVHFDELKKLGDAECHEIIVSRLADMHEQICGSRPEPSKDLTKAQVAVSWMPILVDYLILVLRKRDEVARQKKAYEDTREELRGVRVELHRAEVRARRLESLEPMLRSMLEEIEETKRAAPHGAQK